MATAWAQLPCAAALTSRPHAARRCLQGSQRLSFMPRLSLRPRAPCLLARPLRQAHGRPCRGSALCIRAMVNIDVSPSVLLGVGLIGAGVSLWQIRQVKPEISKDYDVVISCVSLLVGGILIFQGWRLDPLLLFGQLMTTGAAVSFAIEALRLRSEMYEGEEKAQLRSVFDRNKPSEGGSGSALQLLPPEPDVQQQQPWNAYPQQQQQQQQQWEGSGYAPTASGYYDYPQQQGQGQQGAAPSASGAYIYDPTTQQYYATPPATSASNGSGGYEQQQQYDSRMTYSQQQQQQQQQPYVEPDYAMPPGEGGYSYPTEYVFPAEPAAGAAVQPAASGSGSYDYGGGSGAAGWQEQPQQPQAGAGVGQRRSGGGYDAEDW